MSLWVDKYRPTKLILLSHSNELTVQLKQLAENAAEMPHLLVYGPSGAGRKTRVRALLKQLYGTAADKLSIHHKQFTVTSGGNGTTTTKIDCVVMSSMYHLEMTPADNGQTQDRLVVQEVIKEIASAGNLLSSAGGITVQSADQQQKVAQYKVVVLHNADALSQSAQHALRRTMEKYSRNIRLVLVAENTSRIIAPIRSRCLGIRVGAASVDEGAAILKSVCDQEHVSIDGEWRAVLGRVYETAGCNLRRALLMLEAAHVQSAKQSGGRLTIDTPIPLADYSEYLQQTAQLIIKEQSTQQVQKVRTMLYEVLSKCIPPPVVLKELAFALMRSGGDAWVKQVVEAAAYYDERLRCGTASKSIYHLEAFVVKVMVFLKRQSTQ